VTGSVGQGSTLLKAWECNKGTKGGDTHDMTRTINSTTLPWPLISKAQWLNNGVLKTQKSTTPGIEAVDQTELYMMVFTHSSLFH
jgi:hypothetical protein